MEATALGAGAAGHSERRRKLAIHLIIHEVHQQYAGTVLGVSWAILQPALIVGAYFFLFTVLRVVHNAPHGQLGQVAIILSGIVSWLFFMRTFAHGLATLDSHAGLVKQINFPIGVLPFVTVGRLAIDYVLGLIALSALALSQGWASWSLLALIPLGALFTVFLTALAAALAPLGVMLRDLRNLIPVFIRLGLWISPVLYLPGRIPLKLRWVAYANPITYFLGLERQAALGPSFGGRQVTLVGWLPSVGIACGITVIMALIGWASWRRVRRVAVDYL